MRSDEDNIKSFHGTSSVINLGSDNDEDDEEPHIGTFLSSLMKLTLI